MFLLKIFLILSVCCNILLLVLFVHSRCSYRKLMQKSMRQNEPEKKLVAPVNFITEEVANEQERRLLNLLQQVLENDKLYLRQELSIHDVAKAVGTNKTQLSHVINTYLHQNFSSLLNSYRIRESINILSNPDFFREKMEVISEMCGYNNRQVFHAAFKKEMGITPNHFRNIQKITEKKNLRKQEEQKNEQ